MNYKKMMSIGLSAALSLSLLTACGGNNSAGNGSTRNGGFGDSGFLKKAPEKTLQDETSYIIGDKVKHRKFGIGTVVSAQQMGKDCLVVVDFESVGQKKMMAAYANFERVE